MPDFLHIDGSHGEGGGQILRSSLALSLVTGRSIEIDNIRAGRDKPGLLRQHLTAVKAAIEISDAEATGAEFGSRRLTFRPGPIRSREFRFNVGTAGSTTLVLQTVLPALLLADEPTNLVIEGGTHNPWAPPYEFLEQAYIPLINRMGPHVKLALEQAGFAPVGGGRLRVDVQPARRLTGFDLLERGEVVRREATVLLANLPEHIAQRELSTFRRKLNWDQEECRIENIRSNGPGNAIVAVIKCRNVTEVFSNIGRQGIRAEHVAGELAGEVRGYLKADVPVGPHLADQLLLPLGLSAFLGGRSGEGSIAPAQYSEKAGGSYRTLPLTGHSMTHIELLREVLGVQIDVDERPDGNCVVNVAPSLSSSG
jgi:RNA 3'-terminal phosphate cyclase (ATP)